jgi:hypothetical protein
MFNDRDGSGKLLELLQGAVPLASVFPSFTQVDWQSQWPRVGTIMGALALAMVLSRLAVRGIRRREQQDAWMPLTMVLGLVLGLAVAVRLAGDATVHDAVQRFGEMRLLAVWPGDRAVDLKRLSRLSEPALLTRARVHLFQASDAPGSAPADPRRWLGPYPLPAGRFDVHVWRRREGPMAGEIAVAFDRSLAVIARTPIETPRRTVLTVPLPGGVRWPPVWIGVSSPDLVSHVERVELVPVEVARPSIDGHEAARPYVEAAAGRPGGWLAYLDGNAFPEHGEFWTRGTTETGVVVVPGAASAMIVRLQAGAAAGTARLEVAGAETRFELQPGQVESIEVPLRSDRWSVPIQVVFSSAFRPAEVDPASTDYRSLGVRVAVLLR